MVLVNIDSCFKSVIHLNGCSFCIDGVSIRRATYMLYGLPHDNLAYALIVTKLNESATYL